MLRPRLKENDILGDTPFFFKRASQEATRPMLPIDSSKRRPHLVSPLSLSQRERNPKPIAPKRKMFILFHRLNPMDRFSSPLRLQRAAVEIMP